MEPIVSPLFVYILGIVDPVKSMLLLLSALFFMACVVIGFSILASCGLGDKAVEWKKRKVKLALCWAVGLLVFCVVIPSRDVLIAMYIANYITPDNIHIANEVFKSNLQEYINIIVNTINQVK